MPRYISLTLRALRGPREHVSEGPYVRDATHQFGRRFPCFYCPYLADSERGRAQHIQQNPPCLEADLAGVNCTVATLTHHIPEEAPHSANDSELAYSQPNDPLTRRLTTPIPQPQTPEATRVPLHSMPHPPDTSYGGLRYNAVRRVFIQPFSDPRAGAPINNRTTKAPDLKAYMAAMGNLGVSENFETAELLMTTGLTNAGRDRHLKSRLYKGQTPWPSNKKLIDDIDLLPHGPKWEAFEVDIDAPEQRRGSASYLFCRLLIDVIRDILGNVLLKDDMHYAPEYHWTAEDCKTRVYSETWTGNWWWNMQLRLPDKAGTIVPLIIASDRTTLSVMTNGQVAYPVYVTIGNVSKSVRRKPTTRSTVLLAYLPVDEFSHVANAERRGQLKLKLVHTAMRHVLGVLNQASEEGVEILCADGRYRKAYPILAASTLDYQEQCKLGCIVGSSCPKCHQKQDGRGQLGTPAPPRLNHETLNALRYYFNTGGTWLLNEMKIKPVWPFWAGLPYVEFSATLMPDILHQLHQGMIKAHLVPWVIELAGAGQVDLYFSLMPKAEGMRHFSHGISGLGKWTGRESKEVQKQLLAVVASLDGRKWNDDVVRLAREILDFTYRAQASQMTQDDLDRLDKTLVKIHEMKTVLRRMGVFKSDKRFDLIAKLHMLSHYTGDTQAMGTPDGYCTESPEHLHIESKRGYRASNKVKPTPQMIKFIQRYEALRIHRSLMDRYLGKAPGEGEKRRKSRVVYGEDEEAPFVPSWEVSVGHAAEGRAEGRTEGQIERPIVTEAVEGDIDEDVNGDGGDSEDEDEDQVHFQGRMRTSAEAKRHVVYPNPTLSIALKPTAGRVRGLELVAKYGATQLIPALHSYLRKHSSRQNLPVAFLPTAHHIYPVWHRLYLRHQALPFDPEWPKRDVIRARPKDADHEATFDVVLFLDRQRAKEFGLGRYRAGRVRAIFSLPSTYEFLSSVPLVYLELFTHFSTTVSPFNGMHSTSHSRQFDGSRRCAVMSAFDLAAGCHLAPQFKRLDEDLDLTTLPDLLTVGRYFWFNHYYNRFIYRLIDHWHSASEAAHETT
ncbi:hypothetical protein FRC09_002544 [Ceratobasidium sp. 395]|nr:hypothetical protein FRC09_002544 [Ceratobasidium sp. 395]